MLYLGTSPCEPAVADMLDHRRLGLMCQPGSNPPRAGWLWAADNGCFSDKWDETKWRVWLSKDHPHSGCLFAVVPDVVADHEATLARFWDYRQTVVDTRYPVAFVGQDGATETSVPWIAMDCLFIGGTTEWKMSPTAFCSLPRLAAEASGSTSAASTRGTASTNGHSTQTHLMARSSLSGRHSTHRRSLPGWTVTGRHRAWS